jgi:SAM-dependent methyltransferase
VAIIATGDRFVMSLRSFVPRPARRWLRAGYNQALEMKGLVDLLLVQRAQRRRFGERLSFTIDPRDEMCKTLTGRVSWRSKANYLEQSPPNVDELEMVLQAHGRSLATTTNLLDFASGYGRLTRYFSAMLPGHVTVSDIDPAAVQFATRTFYVRGFVSTADPDDLNRPERFDLIWAASLWTHLPHETWGRWLEKVYSMLQPGGVLVFSARYVREFDTLPAELRCQIQDVAPGMRYWPINETGGRLPTGQYGATIVDPSYVRAIVAETNLGRILGHHERALWGAQDLWVIERPPEH